jgi:SAM-dependent methyltransferase
VATEFLEWLNVKSASQWLDVGCGSGALTQTILNQTNPKTIYAIDFSPDYIAYAKEKSSVPNAHFQVADAQELPFEDNSFDATASALVLNFIPDVDKAISEQMRVIKSGGTVAAYVWDYSGKMELMRHFWDAACELNPQAIELDEGPKFPICQLARLETLFDNHGLSGVEVRNIDAPTVFENFDDYWQPFLGGQGPAPGYAMSLSETDRNGLRDHIKQNLPIAEDGSISMISRALAVKGRKP